MLLRKLRDFKHPLGVRRGISRRSTDMTGGETSRILKAKGRTYFFDIKKTHDEKPYLVITESRFRGNDQPSYQARIAVFPEDAGSFFEALEVMMKKL